METQPGLLALIVRQKSPEHGDTYDVFFQRVERALAEGRLVARHGADHWRTVGLYAGRLVPERVFQQMAAGEVLVMAMAAVAHDLQPADGTGYDYLTDPPEVWGADATVANATRLVCEFASTGGRRLERMPRWSYIGREAVDLRRAGAVLLVADRIDLEHTDAPLPVVIRDVPTEKAARWPVERGLAVGLIDPREGLLRLDLTSPNKTWHRQIREHFLAHAEAALDVAKDIFLSSGMPFREIELHDLHAKPTADVARAQEAMRARAGSRRRPQRPFKPLDAFGEDEGHLLGARDEEVLRLTGRALTSPLTVLVGETGVGKTSIVQAGVLPWLREHGYDGVVARCLNDPTRSLLEATRKQLDPKYKGDAAGDAGDLIEAARELSERATAPLLLVLDQCQELFTRLGSVTRLEFAKDLAALLALPREPVHVLLVIQSEFFFHLAELMPALPTIYHEVVELKRLTSDQAATVIRRALGRFRLRFDELVTTHLIDDLSTSEGILPVELQICCDTLHANVEEDEYTVGFDIYRRVGPARRILDGLLDNRLKGVRWRRQALAKGILVNCVTAQRTKALAPVEELSVDIGADEATTQELLDELIEAGLLGRLRLGTKWFYELRHEYLAQRLEPWITDIEREAKDVDDLLHREMNNYEKFQLLLDREKLRLIHQYRRRLTFTPEELELVIRSAAQERFEIEYWFARVNELTVSQQMVLSVDLLYSPEPDLRDALRAMISRLDHKAVLPTLLESLREADVAVRETAIDILREIDVNLVVALEQGDAATKQQAAYALGQIGARHAVRPLVETAQHGTEEVREQAVEALAEIDRFRSSDLLIRSLRTGSRNSRWNAAAALGRLGRDQVIRDRVRREYERSDAPDSLCYAYARACLEGRQFETAEAVLDELDRRPVPDDQLHRLEQARQDLERLRKQEARGLFSWPMYRGSAGGSAYTPQRLNLPLELKWEFATGDCVYSSPVVASGAVFIGSTDKRLYSLDADSGRARWSYDAGAELRSSPCLVGDRVFVGDMEGVMHALESDSGRGLWRRRLGQSIGSSVRGGGERLFVGTADGDVVAFTPDGDELWRVTLGGPVEASPASDQAVVAIGTPESGLLLLDAQTGEERWRLPVSGGLRGSPVLGEATLACGTGDGRVVVVDTEGRERWTAQLEDSVNSSPAIAHERLYVGTSTGAISCLDLAGGEVVWSFQAEGEVSASPTVAAQTVFVGSHGGHLYALKAASGELLWQYRTGYSIHSTPAVADGRLFVALRYYNLCAFAEPVEVEDVRR